MNEQFYDGSRIENLTVKIVKTCNNETSCNLLEGKWIF